jgi:hypothetical protein
MDKGSKYDKNSSLSYDDDIKWFVRSVFLSLDYFVGIAYAMGGLGDTSIEWYNATRNEWKLLPLQLTHWVLLFSAVAFGLTFICELRFIFILHIF